MSAADAPRDEKTGENGSGVLRTGVRYDRSHGFEIEVVEVYGSKTCRVRIRGHEVVYTQEFVLRRTSEEPEGGLQMVLDV